MIEAQGLQVALAGRVVLRELDVAFSTGWTAVVGPNGAGKSTLLRALAGLLEARRGSIRLLGRPLKDWPVRDRARQVAWLAQQVEMSADLPVRDVVRLGRLPHLGMLGQLTPGDESAVDEALQATGSQAWSMRRLQDLSGGERQRVLLARALAVQAPILLLDEPTAHLDPPHQVGVVRLLRALARTHTVVTVLHDLNLALRADRLLVLQQGQVAGAGRTDDRALHPVLEQVFQGAFSVCDVGAGWMAVPCLTGEVTTRFRTGPDSGSTLA